MQFTSVSKLLEVLFLSVAGLETEDDRYRWALYVAIVPVVAVETLTLFHLNHRILAPAAPSMYADHKCNAD
jgi:hypothetical protein